MDKIRSLVVISTIAIILLLVITEQANAEDRWCGSRCTTTDACNKECTSHPAYSSGECINVGTYKACCCVVKDYPPRLPNL
ncbi:hypothetical protein EUTSA_v10026706mg [Eutrema salsugineum]|uniref:Knottin scorpion toxin-like domain-containing protein n=1 Tax=Eutrema salsugineum TaxID=72664 RepID=V4MA52_EUTSA|nr:hypothetical protein EUTSA_v10026706mg [Eutrema salsugineum]